MGGYAPSLLLDIFYPAASLSQKSLVLTKLSRKPVYDALGYHL